MIVMERFTRRAKIQDVDAIVEIIKDAKALLKAAGSPQWQSGYPNRETILDDIKNNNGYVFVVGNQVAAYAAVVVGSDPNYAKIDGAWQNNDDPYATVHRICISSDFQGQGLAGIFYSNILSLLYARGVRNFRVDTYKLNKPMQKLTKNNGYGYRGIIQVEDPIDPDRLAYELNLE